MALRMVTPTAGLLCLLLFAGLSWHAEKAPANQADQADQATPSAPFLSTLPQLKKAREAMAKENFAKAHGLASTLLMGNFPQYADSAWAILLASYQQMEKRGELPKSVQAVKQAHLIQGYPWQVTAYTHYAGFYPPEGHFWLLLGYDYGFTSTQYAVHLGNNKLLPKLALAYKLNESHLTVNKQRAQRTKPGRPRSLLVAIPDTATQWQLISNGKDTVYQADFKQWKEVAWGKDLRECLRWLQARKFWNEEGQTPLFNINSTERAVLAWLSKPNMVLHRTAFLSMPPHIQDFMAEGLAHPKPSLQVGAAGYLTKVEHPTEATINTLVHQLKRPANDTIFRMVLQWVHQQQPPAAIPYLKKAFERKFFNEGVFLALHQMNQQEFLAQHRQKILTYYHMTEEIAYWANEYAEKLWVSHTRNTPNTLHPVEAAAHYIPEDILTRQIPNEKKIVAARTELIRHTAPKKHLSLGTTVRVVEDLGGAYLVLTQTLELGIIKGYALLNNTPPERAALREEIRTAWRSQRFIELLQAAKAFEVNYGTPKANELGFPLPLYHFFIQTDFTAQDPENSRDKEWSEIDSLQVVDLDHDGIQEVLLARRWMLNGERQYHLEIYRLHAETNHYRFWTVLDLNVKNYERTGGVEWALPDLDQDGVAEIMVFRYPAKNDSYYSYGYTIQKPVFYFRPHTNGYLKIPWQDASQAAAFARQHLQTHPYLQEWMKNGGPNRAWKWREQLRDY